MREFLRVNTYNKNTINILAHHLQKLFYQKNIVFVCVGSNKVIFDSLGCFVGNMLKSNNFIYYVYGDLQYNINSKNISYAIEFIRQKHVDAIICVIDAMVTNNQGHLNDILITDSYIGGINSIKIDADIFIYGITAIYREKELPFGANLYNIYQMASTITKSLILCQRH